MTKLLFIWYKHSKGILEGGGQCSMRNFNSLCEIVGADNIVSFYVHDEYKEKTILDYLCGAVFFLFNYFYRLSPRRLRKLLEDAYQYDYIFIDRSVFGLIAKKLKLSGYNGKVITHFHNVESVYFDALLPKWLPGRSVLLHAVNKNDEYACRYSDEIIVLNNRDKSILCQKYAPSCRITSIPIALSDRFDEEQINVGKTRNCPICLFFGSYFTPNNQGILWFVDNVLPYVNIEMKIVGKGMDKLKADSPKLQSIDVVSDAPDLSPYLNEADIIVLPIFSGSGMKVKTCEALMYGKNILGTKEAFEGYDLDFQKLGGLCNNAEEFIMRINDFVDNPRPHFNTYARQMFVKNYSHEAVKQLFVDFLK